MKLSFSKKKKKKKKKKNGVFLTFQVLKKNHDPGPKSRAGGNVLSGTLLKGTYG